VRGADDALRLVPRLPELRFDEWLQLSGGTRTMAIRDKIAANAQPHLQPGEQIQGVFSAQTMSQWWILLTIFILLFGNRYRRRGSRSVAAIAQ
jgi:hypothetical protein